MKNATKYVECFMARDDLTPQLKKITDDALIVVGAKGKRYRFKKCIQIFIYCAFHFSLRFLLGAGYEVFIIQKKSFDS